MSTPPAAARRIGTRSTWHRRSCAAAGWRPYLTRVRPHARLVRNPRALDRCGDRSSPRIQGHLVAIMRSRSSGSLAAGPSASPEAADHPRRLPTVVLEYQPCAASQGFALVGRGPASLACVHEARRSRGDRRWRSGSRRCGGRRRRDRRSRACPWRFRPRSARIRRLAGQRLRRRGLPVDRRRWLPEGRQRTARPRGHRLSADADCSTQTGLARNDRGCARGCQDRHGRGEDSRCSPRGTVHLSAPSGRPPEER